MKQSWKKWLRNATFGVMAVAALGVIAGCGNDNAAPADKSVVIWCDKLCRYIGANTKLLRLGSYALRYWRNIS